MISDFVVQTPNGQCALAATARVLVDIIYYFSQFSCVNVRIIPFSQSTRSVTMEKAIRLTQVDPPTRLRFLGFVCGFVPLREIQCILFWLWESHPRFALRRDVCFATGSGKQSSRQSAKKKRRERRNPRNRAHWTFKVLHKKTAGQESCR